jgi:hypothetical protein
VPSPSREPVRNVQPAATPDTYPCQGTPRGFAAGAAAHLLALATAEGAVLVVLVITTGTEAAMLAVSFRPEPPG